VLLLNAHRVPELPNGARPGRIVLMPELGDVPTRGAMPLIAAACAGAAARLTGVVSGEALRQTVEAELAALSEEVRAHNMELALSAYHHMDDFTGIVEEGATPSAADVGRPHWIDPPTVELVRAVPTILRGGTTVLAQTGLWRTERPTIDPERCKHCWWVCSTFCPDGVIAADGDGVPPIDYDHCKGCLICLAQCPSHAIEAVLEHGAGPDATAATNPGATACAS